MGRSVSVPSGAEVVTYVDISEIDNEDAFEFDHYIDDLTWQLKNKMPSLQECDKWLDREDRAILENSFAYIGISTYGGIMSLWVVPKEEYEQLACIWISKIAWRVTKLGDLTKQGTMDNGVSVYKRKV